MGHGEYVAVNDTKIPDDYYFNVRKDVQELQKLYPFACFIFLPLRIPKPIVVHVIAVDCTLIKKTCAYREDFIQDFSKELEIIVPFDYRVSGCDVYGGRWIDLEKIPMEDQHFYKKLEDGRFQFCVGVPESFSKMKNVVLENVRTADKMLTAYELFQKGLTRRVELIAYAHGQKGINEYRGKKKKYQTK